MFETATLSYGPSGKRMWTTAMGFTGQALLVACGLLAPMISPQALPRVTWLISVAPPGPPPPPPRPMDEVTTTRSSASVSQIRAGKLFVPTKIPAIAQILVDPEPVLPSGPPGVPGGLGTGREGTGTSSILTSLIDSAARFVPVVKPPEVKHENPPPTHAAPPRITTLRMATPIHRVDPIYPALAKQARVSGVVELVGVLGVDGRIHELKVLRGHPLLVNAAMEAVRQWVYEPTMLNGQAVEVSAPIVVNFILK
uniref:TonB family protein n=1 Tax=Solibacter usitatus (strain Ellin6076) TaxID=234267 RepID=Q01Y30_SOLUE